MLQRNPELTPDQVKGLLRSSADLLANTSDPTQGAGLLDVKGAVELLEKGNTAAYPVHGQRRGATLPHHAAAKLPRQAVHGA